jgi:AcrR family transcriptional regulator
MKRTATRGYDSPGRAEQAQRTRAKIVDAAGRAFAKAGYAATTVKTIADLAGVSVETLYKGFGGKPGLIRALHARALAGRGAVPAPVRADAFSARATDPYAIVRAWGTLAAEVSPRVSPLLLLVRAAAHTDPELVDILEHDGAQRLARMRHNAQRLADRGFLRAGVSVHQAADVMWALTAPETYELLVARRRWTPRQLGDHIATTLAGLLRPRTPGPGRASRGRLAAPARRAPRPSRAARSRR